MHELGRPEADRPVVVGAHRGVGDDDEHPAGCVRLTRLVGKDVVTRTPSPDDARGTVVTLTAKGLRLFDEVAPAHLANEEVLLSALTDTEREQLAGLLRKLLVGFEHERVPAPWA